MSVKGAPGVTQGNSWKHSYSRCYFTNRSLYTKREFSVLILRYIVTQYRRCRDIDKGWIRKKLWIFRLHERDMERFCVFCTKLPYYTVIWLRYAFFTNTDIDSNMKKTIWNKIFNGNNNITKSVCLLELWVILKSLGILWISLLFTISGISFTSRSTYQLVNFTCKQNLDSKILEFVG